MMSHSQLDGIDSVAHVRPVDEGDRYAIVFDFGPGRDNITCDVLDDVIIIVDGDGEQYELPIPGSTARTFMKNGILTIEVDA